MCMGIVHYIKKVKGKAIIIRIEPGVQCGNMNLLNVLRRTSVACCMSLLYECNLCGEFTQ